MKKFDIRKKSHIVTSIAATILITLVIVLGFLFALDGSNSSEKTLRSQKTNQKISIDTSTSTSTTTFATIPESTTTKPRTYSTSAPTTKTTTVVAPKNRVATATAFGEGTQNSMSTNTVSANVKLTLDPIDASFPVTVTFHISVNNNSLERVVTQSSTDNSMIVSTQFEKPSGSICGSASFWATVKWDGGSIMTYPAMVGWSDLSHTC